MSFVSCKDDNDSAETVVPAPEVTTLNVDVVLPADIRQQWQPTIDWALQNISSAQRLLPNQVKLNLRYHDEDKVDVEDLAYQLTQPKEGEDKCHAIIGPYHSENALKMVHYAAHDRLPFMMPVCTSSELQRINARNTYAWFLTESDVTQCEIMVAGAARLGEVDVALITSDDTYGQSFFDWFGYYATEQQLHIAGEGVTTYTRGASLTPFLDGVGADCENGLLVVCIALGAAEDYEAVTEQVRLWTAKRNESGAPLNVSVILSDTALEDQVVQSGGLWFSYGISPTASPNYGFPQYYEGRFGKSLHNGEAQMYDALMILALGAAHQRVHDDDCKVRGRQVVYYEKPYGPTLTDHIRSIVASEQGTSCGWDALGLARAFSEVNAGRDISLTGASGSLTFDSETNTKVLNTNYMMWRISLETGKPAVQPVFYISTEGSNTMASTTSLWELDKTWSQVINDEPVDHSLPTATDRWAVIISPSTTWGNYRHQADAFAMYQTLRHHGYDDDHIVLIVEDNLANDALNSFPGQIFVERSNDSAAENDPFINDDVRKNAKVDYRFSDLQPDDLCDIMMGRSSARLPHVIRPTATSNVFFFWSGHGGSREGPLWGDETAHDYFGVARLRSLVEQMNGGVSFSDTGASLSNRHYRRMLFAIETCFSGLWGQALEGQPDVLVLTAANGREKSKADVHDGELGVYLSNAFARSFRRMVESNPAITIYDLYRDLFRTTKGSHVSIYNQQQYGSVYSETMSDYLQ